MTPSDLQTPTSSAPPAQKSFHLDPPSSADPSLVGLSQPLARSPSPSRATSRKGRRGWLRRMATLLIVGAAVTGLGWYGATRVFSARKVDQVLTAPVAKGELVINVTERGELESS